MWSIIESTLDLVSAFVDFLKVSSVSVSALQLIGIVLVAFLLGLLLGRITKRGVRQAVESAHEQEAGGVSLNIERLTPLGSLEEKPDNPTMDISDLRPDHGPEGSAAADRKEQREPTLLKE